MKEWGLDTYKFISDDILANKLAIKPVMPVTLTNSALPILSTMEKIH